MSFDAAALGTAGAALAAATALTLAPVAGAHGSRSTGECGLPDSAPLWIDYGEASVKPDVRAVFSKPGVVVASSGTIVPPVYRNAGAATTYFELHLANIAGDTAEPADPATVIPETDALYDRAVKSTACTTPWIALNELQGSQLAMPWSATNAAYRANVLTILQRLAARGAHPALLVHGNPTVAGDTAAWWLTASQSASLVYEAYFDASKIFPLGPVIANRRMRLALRFTSALFESAGVPRSRLGFMFGFHSALTPGIAGRQGLEPTEAWLRVVKWEALAARQVAGELQIPTLWTWGWGTFGPDSVDPDKPVAACTWLWARDTSLCDAPSMAGPGFAPSLVEGQIVLPEGTTCSFADGRMGTRAVTTLARLTKDRQAALTAQFARAALVNLAPVAQGAVLQVERTAIATAFKGNRKAYVRALARRGADVAVARGAIADELRRRAIAKQVGASQTTFDAVGARESTAVDTAICLRDELPGIGEPLARSNARDVGTIPLLSWLPFLFRDKTAPATPVALAATRVTQTVTLTWTSGREPDLAGYDVFRTVPGGTPQKLNLLGLVGRTTFIDAPAPVGSTYSIQAVDTSGNRSELSPAVGS
jgi:hypothetical protein